MISSAITAFFKAVAQIFQTKETSLKQQTTTEVVRDKKNLKKATDVAEQLLVVCDKYIFSFSEEDKEKYLKLKKRFMKYN